MKVVWCDICQTKLLSTQRVVDRHYQKEHKKCLSEYELSQILAKGKAPKEEPVSGKEIPEDEAKSKHADLSARCVNDKSGTKNASRKREKQFKRLIEVLGLSRLSKRTNADQLISSREFYQASEIAMQSQDLHGDTSKLLKILDCFADSNGYRPLVEWYCRTLGMTVVLENGDIRLRNKKGKKRIQPLTRGDCLVRFKGTKAEVIRELERKVGKDTKDQEYLDLMESGTRLPGSFGSGKRR